MSYRDLRAFLLFAAVALPANAGNPTVNDGWFRSLPNNLPAAGYFTLKNNTTKPISLTGAASPACGMLMLHKSEQVGGMNRMTMVDKVDVPQGGSVKFAPGGYHLMCMEPGPTMKPGGSVPVTLQFADGTTFKSQFVVKGATGK
jgi:periplasmic copper chaperone A